LAIDKYAECFLFAMCFTGILGKVTCLPRVPDKINSANIWRLDKLVVCGSEMIIEPFYYMIVVSQEIWLVHDGIGYASSPLQGFFFLAKISMAVVLNFV
jgi:hypothetical protein